jgi:methylmalonyl-CoA mutase
MSEKIFVIPPHRTVIYLKLPESNRKYDVSAVSQEQVAQNYMEFSKR